MSASGNGRTRGVEAAAHAGRTLAWPGDPQGLTADGIDIEALAHVLANTCRFGGRTRRFYAVAQRAVAASEEIGALEGLDAEDRRRLALHALLADARIAWLGDAQAHGPASTRAAERSRRDGAAIDRAVREAAGLDGDLTDEQADLLRFVARMTDAAERRDLPDAGMGAPAGAAFPPLKGRIRPVEPGKAAKLWLARYRTLTEPPGAAPGPATGAGARHGDLNATDRKEKDDVANLAKTQGTQTAHGRQRGDGGQALAA